MAGESVRKTAAKKTVRRSVTSTAAVSRVPKRTVTRKTSSRSTAVAASSTPQSTPRRKAPTTVTTVSRTSKRSNYFLWTGVVCFVLLFGIGAFIGVSADGAINVQNIIANRMSSASPEERAILEQAARATLLNNIPDGGLVPSGATPEVAPTATSTASTSSPLATTTASSTPTATTTVEDGGLVPTADAQ